jgi:hypothetical protein
MYISPERQKKIVVVSTERIWKKGKAIPEQA